MKRFAIILMMLGCAAPRPSDDRISELTSLLSAPAMTANTEALERIKLDAPARVEDHTEFTRPTDSPLAFSSTEFADWYVVEFGQQSCPPCRRWEATEKPILMAEMGVRTIDINAEPALARKHGIKATPTILICQRSSGKTRARFVAYASAGAIRQKIRDLKRKTVTRTTYRSTATNYGGHWSIGSARNPRRATRGEIIQHLETTHQVSQLDTMTTDQLLSLHDSLHEGSRW
jgi:hypothetical protein